jgi:hypothetical protein
MKAPTNTNTTATSFVMGCSLFTSTGKTRGGMQSSICNLAFSFPQQIALNRAFRSIDLSEMRLGRWPHKQKDRLTTVSLISPRKYALARHATPLD